MSSAELQPFCSGLDIPNDINRGHLQCLLVRWDQNPGTVLWYALTSIEDDLIRPMSSNNVLGDQWVGGPMRRGPMRWGTNERGDQWADPDKLYRMNFNIFCTFIWETYFTLIWQIVGICTRWDLRHRQIWYWIILIPACLSNHIPSKMWDEITYPFPNFNGATVEVWERISNFIPHFIMDVITYPYRD